MTLGRPGGLTPLRLRVLTAYQRQVLASGRINKAQIARECRLPDRQGVNRILAALRALGLLDGADA